jgi:hypothetical protein
LAQAARVGVQELFQADRLAPEPQLKDSDRLGVLEPPKDQFRLAITLYDLTPHRHRGGHQNRHDGRDHDQRHQRETLLLLAGAPQSRTDPAVSQLMQEPASHHS